MANYGYIDGSGEYYISIKTDSCIDCADHPCVAACPKEVFEIIEDDYGDRVATVKEKARRSLQFVCADCKPASNPPPLPCTKACPANAIGHTW